MFTYLDRDFEHTGVNVKWFTGTVAVAGGRNSLISFTGKETSIVTLVNR